MSMIRLSKSALINQSISFTASDGVNPHYMANFIDIISLDGVDGSPVIPTIGAFEIYAKTDIDGGFKKLPNRGSLDATKTGGSALADGLAVGATFEGFPLEFKIVPVDVDVAAAYVVHIKQASNQLDRTPDDFINSFETSDRGGTGLAVFVQDQTTGLLDVPFLQDRGNFTLAIAVTVDTRTFTASPGHNIVIGESIELADLGTETFMQAIVLNVVGDVITIDTPLNFPYSTDDVGVRSILSLMVDGSVTPQIFSILPLPDQLGDMVRVQFTLESDSEMDFSTFGGANALTNGCVLRVNHGDGTYTNIFNFKNNGDIIHQTFDHAFLQPKAGNTTKGFVARLTWGGQSKHGVVVRLDGRLNEALEVVIQDDLTAGNTKFVLVGQGSEVQK